MHLAAERSDEARARVTGSVVHATVVAALGGLLFGFDTAVISGATGSLEGAFGLTPQALGFTVAIALIGTVLGSLAAAKPADAWGRRPLLRAVAALYLLSALGCAAAMAWWHLLLARFLGGIGVGVASVVTPLYIAEIAPGPARGRLVAVNQLNVVSGILLAFLSNWLTARWAAPESAWRWMLGVQAAPSALFLALLFTIPESPRWLVRRGRDAAAAAVLSRLGTADVAARIAEIRSSLAGGEGGESLFRRRYARPVFLALAMAMFNQLAGINALLYYAPKIFALAGAGRDSALFQSVLLGGTNLVFTFLAFFVIDRFGRRLLMRVGSAGLILTLGAVAWQLSRGPLADGRIVLGALLLYVAFFAFSQGACIWVFLSEIFPNAVRAKGQTLGSFTHWIMAAAVSWTFPVVARESGAAAFVFFALMMVLQLAWALCVMPETRGGTLEDIGRRLGTAEER